MGGLCLGYPGLLLVPQMPNGLPSQALALSAPLCLLLPGSCLHLNLSLNPVSYSDSAKPTVRRHGGENKWKFDYSLGTNNVKK